VEIYTVLVKLWLLFIIVTADLCPIPTFVPHPGSY